MEINFGDVVAVSWEKAPANPANLYVITAVNKDNDTAKIKSLVRRTSDAIWYAKTTFRRLHNGGDIL